MALTPGTRLGIYEVTALIGEGGMGQVYRARDAKLNRDVALKVLPDSFATDPDRLARFTREAQALASLNHPNIAHVYGLEQGQVGQVGRDAGTSGIVPPALPAAPASPAFIVMELVEGEDLSQRIARGAIPLDEALPIAKQTAEALEAAHEQNIIHRDLKPANIKVRPDGTVKVLDFGLAKAMDAGAGGPGMAGGNLSQSPTITTPAMTQAGMILGTAAYMSPEQAKGRSVDRRADVWAFGAVLYELLTGERAFAGEDVSDTFANVLKSEPDWHRLPAEVPARVRQVLRACLQKNARQRIGDMQDVRLALEGAFETGTGPVDASYMLKDEADAQARAAIATLRDGLAQSARRRLAVVTVAAVVVGAAIAAGGVWYAMRSAPARILRAAIAHGGTGNVAISGLFPDVAITPDGSRVIYSGGVSLLVRALDSLEPTTIAGSSGIGTASRPLGPFVSPDGQWVGFTSTGRTLNKVAITGGPPIMIANVDGAWGGAAWMPDDTIIFSTSTASTGLQRVSAGGGETTTLTTPNRERGESDHLWPEVLPGGRAVLFTITALSGGLGAAQIAVYDLATGTQKVVLRGGTHGHYAASGHLVYTAGGTLRAVAFDLDHMETLGTPVPVLPRLVTTASGAGDFEMSADGTLVYVDAPGRAAGAQRTLVWVDRAGRERPIPTPPRAYLYPRLSADGTRVALDVRDQENDVWIWDLKRETLARLTFEPGNDQSPTWAPDGGLFFGSTRDGNATNLFWQAADGSGAARRLARSGNLQNPTSVSPDGRRVIFYEATPTEGRDIMVLTLDGNKVEPLIHTRFEELNGAISLNGRWLAYESNSSGGQFEVFVRPYPNVDDGQFQISTGGGVQPGWARNGEELFYFSPDGSLMSARVNAQGTVWSAAAPAKLFEGRYFTGGGANLVRNFDVSPDGKQFLMIKEGGGDQTATPPQIIIVQHWFEELKRLVPTK